MKILPGVTFGLVIGQVLALLPRRPTESSYTPMRTKFVLMDLELALPADTLVLGASISEAINFEHRCGKTFNAAIEGTKMPDVARLALLAFSRVRPRTIVPSVGTNHFRNGLALTDGFKRDYLEVARSLPGRKILVGVPNSAQATAFVRGVARSIDAAYGAPLSGELASDVVHPTLAGARIYCDQIATACA